jgi:hypothetical protein
MLDAIRAIQATIHRSKMELSADYTDYADFVLQLRLRLRTKQNAISSSDVLAHRQSATLGSNLRNLCNLRILKSFVARKRNV